MVKQGDLLFTLDGRAIEAQIRQAEGQLARDQAQLEGAERDVRRYTDLVAKSATPVINLDNAKTQADTFRGAIKADEGSLENLKVQLSYCTIRAPITGRISMAAVKVGNFVRQADLTPLATIIQTAPIYVTFTLPQRSLPDIREALRAETATIEAIVPGDDQARERRGDDDREYGRSDHRHGDGARHHAERGRGAVARHAGDRATDAARRGGASSCRRPRCRSARPAPSSSSSRTASPTVRPVKVARAVDERIRHRDPASRRRDGRDRRPAAAHQRHEGSDPRRKKAGVLTWIFPKPASAVR